MKLKTEVLISATVLCYLTHCCNNVNEENEGPFNSLLECRSVYDMSSMHFRFKEAAAVFDEVQGLFLLLVGKKFSSPSYPNANLLHRVISLLFYTCASVRELSTEKFTSEAEQLTKKMWEQLSKSIAGDWIVCHFSPKFGDPEKGIFRKAKEDIQVHTPAALDMFL